MKTTADKHRNLQYKGVQKLRVNRSNGTLRGYKKRR